MITRHADDFKQEEHSIQTVYDVTILEGNTFELNTDAFNVLGGKIEIRKPIEQNRVKACETLVDADGYTYDCNLEDDTN